MSALASFGQDFTVAVFGASGGIGHAVTEIFDQQDAVKRLYAVSRRPITKDFKKAQTLSFDLLNEATIERAVSAIEGPIDIAFVATGLLHGAEETQMQPEKTWRTVSLETATLSYQVNCLGPMLVAKHILPRLRRENKSVFAAISARVGSISDNRMGGWYSYRAAKAALNQMIKCAAVELARKNEHALCVGLHPGTVDTLLSKPFQSSVREGGLFTPEKSAQAMVDVLEGLHSGDSGKLFAWDGKEITP